MDFLDQFLDFKMNSRLQEDQQSKLYPNLILQSREPSTPMLHPSKFAESNQDIQMHNYNA